MNKILLLGVASIAMIGCTVERMPETQSITTTPEVVETAAPTTAAPTTTEAPTTTAAPVTAPPVTAPRVTAPPMVEFDYCGLTGPNIRPDTVLSGLPMDYNDPDYCKGFVVMQELGPTEPTVCDEFWNLGDDQIMDIFMGPDGGSNSYMASVGMVDGLWLYCS